MSQLDKDLKYSVIVMGTHPTKSKCTLVHRKKGDRGWDLVSGGFKAHEMGKPWEAAKREFKEETGLDLWIDPTDRMKGIRAVINNPFNKKVHFFIRGVAHPHKSPPRFKPNREIQGRRSVYFGKEIGARNLKGYYNLPLMPIAKWRLQNLGDITDNLKYFIINYDPADRLNSVKPDTITELTLDTLKRFGVELPEMRFTQEVKKGKVFAIRNHLPLKKGDISKLKLTPHNLPPEIDFGI